MPHRIYRPPAMTVRQVHQWLASLPEEWQEKEFVSMIGGGTPVSLKRIVAVLDAEDASAYVVANPMSTHLPFDNSLTWVKTLTD